LRADTKAREFQIGAAHLRIANLETAAPPVVTRGWPIGAPVALWGAGTAAPVVVEVLAEGSD
jgi:hypothetical protein